MVALSLRTPDASAPIIPADMAPEQRAARATEIRKRLVELFEVQVTTFVEVGSLLLELQSLGEDISDFKMWWVPYVLKVAHGQLHAELVRVYWGRSKLLRIVAKLLPPEQDKLLDKETGGRVEMLTYTPDGRQNLIMVHPLEMSDRQLRQAFAESHVRTKGEQATWLAAVALEEKQKPPSRVSDFKIDRELGEFSYGKKKWSKSVAVTIVKALS